MTTVARQELINGIKRDLYEFFFEEMMDNPIQSQYGSIFTSSAIDGDAEVKNSGLMNVTFKETGYREAVEYTDPTSGRKHVGRLKKHTAGMRIGEELQRDASKPALKNLLKNWQEGALRQFRLKKEEYFFDFFNKAAFTAGDPIFNNTSGLFIDPGADLLYDSKPLLNLSDNTRTLLRTPSDGTTNSFSNLLGATSKPLTSDNLDSAYVKIRYTNAYNEAGQRQILVPSHLVVSPSLRTEAFQILKTVSGIPGDVNHGANQNFGLLTLVESPFVTNATAWYVYAKNGKWLAYDQRPIQFKVWDNPETDEIMIKCIGWYGANLMSWNNISGGNSPTS